MGIRLRASPAIASSATPWRATQLIGQAARSVSAELQAAHAEIPWREMIGMRNVVVHDYADVDLSLVWKTVREDLPGLIERLNAILEEGSAP
jgi:uncharacterized protein with HEPN domain